MTNKTHEPLIFLHPQSASVIIDFLGKIIITVSYKIKENFCKMTQRYQSKLRQSLELSTEPSSLAKRKASHMTFFMLASSDKLSN